MPADPKAVLARVKDPELRATLQLIVNELTSLRGEAANIGLVSRPLETPLDAGGNALGRVADPSDPEDAVNLRTLDRYIQGVLTGNLKKPATRPDPVPTPPTPGSPAQPPSTPPSGPVPPEDPSDPTPEPVPSGPIGPYPAPQPGSGNLRIAGKYFRTPAGSLYRWKSCTDFLLYKRYLDGEAIGPILADRAAAGATMVRVLGMCRNIADFQPAAYASYFTSLPTFADALAAAGFDLEFTVFADAQLIDTANSFGEQTEHLQAVRNALLGKANVVIELVNEAWQNGVEPSLHTPVSGILASSGSGFDGGPNLPPWDWGTIHPPRDAEWFRKAKDAFEYAEILNRPVIPDEPMGANEVAIPGRRDTDPDHFYWFAAISMILGAGATFHSEDGIFSRVWGPVQATCASAFYSAINAVPEGVMGGTYTRSGLADLPIRYNDDALRIYCRYVSNLACCVVVDPAPAYSLFAINGWTVVSSTGPLAPDGSGTLVVLSK